MLSTPQINCGLDCPIASDLFGTLQEVDRLQYTYACIPVIHPRFRRKYGPGGVPYSTGFTRSDMLLDPGDWSDRVVARISPYINVDTPYPTLRQMHEDSFVEEINYCRGVGITVALITLRGPNNNNLARIMKNHFTNGCTHCNFWIQIPMESPRKRAFGSQYDNEIEVQDDTWYWWNNLHKQTDYDKRVSVALKLSADLPSEGEIERWFGESIKCLLVPTNVFCTNKKGYPVLSKAHQVFVKQLLNRDVQMVITGASRHMDITCYVKYLQHLWKSDVIVQDPMKNYAKGWEDYLQFPLQPLSDNLDSYTYNIFEKDPVKYDYYQNAILAALKFRYNIPVVCKCDKGNELKENSIEKVIKSNEFVTSSEKINEESKQNDENKCKCQHRSVVMVLGAGRGPLVRAVLNAATMANVNVKIYAVEKNPTALVTLHGQQKDLWKDKVTVIANDMRKFQPDELADIIVSELLGSFGDNELSPECLDGARHLLKADGISIPNSYTSYINPVMCPRLWAYAKTSENSQLKNSNPLETPWVVYLQNKYDIAPPQELFTFTHPCEQGDGSHVERRRWKCLRFSVERACTLHGFSGYFTCLLFEGHHLSIHPDTHSPGMISWFPIFFPIKAPISLKENDTVEVNFWRCGNHRKIWYEWNVTLPELQVIHNSCGKSSEMFL